MNGGTSYQGKCCLEGAVYSTWRRNDSFWQPMEMCSRQLFVKKGHEASPGKSGFGNCQQITPFKAMKWIPSWEKVQKRSKRGLRGKPWDTPTLRSLVHRNETANETKWPGMW